MKRVIQIMALGFGFYLNLAFSVAEEDQQEFRIESGSVENRERNGNPDQRFKGLTTLRFEEILPLSDQIQFMKEMELSSSQQEALLMVAAIGIRHFTAAYNRSPTLGRFAGDAPLPPDSDYYYAETPVHGEIIWYPAGLNHRSKKQIFLTYIHELIRSGFTESGLNRNLNAEGTRYIHKLDPAFYTLLNSSDERARVDARRTLDEHWDFISMPELARQVVEASTKNNRLVSKEWQCGNIKLNGSGYSLVSNNEFTNGYWSIPGDADANYSFFERARVRTPADRVEGLKFQILRSRQFGELERFVKHLCFDKFVSQFLGLEVGQSLSYRNGGSTRVTLTRDLKSGLFATVSILDDPNSNFESGPIQSLSKLPGDVDPNLGITFSIFGKPKDSGQTLILRFIKDRNLLVAVYASQNFVNLGFSKNSGHESGDINMSRVLINEELYHDWTNLFPVTGKK